MRTEVEIEWASAGPVTVEDDQLLIPKLPSDPGVYQWVFRHEGRERRYVGEAANLYRRFRQYVRPGPTQTTNQKMKARVLRVAAAEGSVELMLATSVKMTCDGKIEPVDLHDQHHRYAAEATAIIHLRRMMGEIINGKGFGALRDDPVLG